LEIKTFIEYYYRQIKIAFIIFVSLSILISLLDVYFNIDDYKYLRHVNFSTVVFLVLSLLLHFRFRVSLKTCLIIALYSIVLNFLYSHFIVEQTLENTLFLLFRETVFLLLMLIFSGLFIQKIHAIIIFFFLLFRYTLIAIQIQPPFLIENLPAFYVTFIAIVLIVYFFAGNLHRSIKNIQIQQNEILKANENLQLSAEDLSNKNKKLQDMNMAKDQFFSVLSHDLRSPLSALQGFTSLLLERGNAENENKWRYYVENIKNSSDTLDKLLNNLLEWSRSQSNQIKYQPEEFKLKDLMESVCYYLKHPADLKGVMLINSVDEKHTVYADFNMIFTVMRNLVSNAIKFSFRSNPVIIVSEEIGNKMKLMVVDEGTGMPPESVEKLFQIGETFSEPGTNRETGTGLGLVICKEFVTKNKGKIGVESEQGSGSTFWISLPKKTK